ncbi:MAG TPA: aminoacyl-tRNA hydrolase [Candidatus Pacearchaeota archaeon]|nr:aminoacyl-tRNA hydrolase [Candidatus Parcubacteria bacterium]HNZ83885.1 aminoacyl-tRNA hydrolase [Candidatus Pacearchaeota archaeon]HOU45555.1 aminoacyl-tRNA hydrolase [Candidatus Pacearchaeota archaeon]HPM08418.1 aminoacyl-tRNA hydrolase [Candidatus Pacearchaeota archaeon]HQI74288.1 aminoacyl-tRNA hydrolase [Candidatus Pacearchaeota archaeon]
MYLIAGLGNPGKEYQNTRHNLGFMALDLLASDWEEKFDALISKTQISNKDVVLVKPQTFMNLSGKAISQIMNFYKIKDLIVIHDEMDIDLGKVKISENKNSGGHKGVQSIIDLLGTKEFIRIRIGIGRSKDQASEFVLGEIHEEQKTLIQKSIEEAIGALKEIIENGYNSAANKYN